MSSIPSFISRLFGGTYERLPNQSNDQLPGAFPDEFAQNEAPEPEARNWLNSESLNSGVRTAQNWLKVIIVKPIIVILVVFFRILAKIFSIIYFKDQQAFIPEDSRNQVPYHTTDPVDKVNKFVRDLEDNLMPQQHSDSATYLPPFFEGSYTQALYMAINRAKFLFVYVTNPNNDGSSLLFKKIVTNPNFISIFNDNDDTIIWGGDLTNSEAYQLANSLNVTKFPFLGLLCLTRTVTMSQSGPVKTSPKISLVSKIQGSFGDDVDENQLIKNKFYRKMEKYRSELVQIRNELRDTYMSQLLQRQQDINYENSVALDRAKVAKKKYQALRKQYLNYKASSFSQEPTGDISRIAIKLKNGTRISRTFSADSTVADIFLYLELYNEGVLGESSTISETEAQTLFNGFELKYNFRLISPLPPRVSLDDMDARIRDIDVIYPNGILIEEPN